MTDADADRGSKRLSAALASVARLGTPSSHACAAAIETTLEALLRVHVRGRLRGICDPPSFVRTIHARTGTRAAAWTRAIPIGCLRGSPFGLFTERDAENLAAECCDSDGDVGLVRVVATTTWELVFGDPSRATVGELSAAIGRAHGHDDAAGFDACASGLSDELHAEIHPLVRDLFIELTHRSPREDDPAFEAWWRRYPGG